MASENTADRNDKKTSHLTMLSPLLSARTYKDKIGPTFRQAPHNPLVGQLPLNDIRPINLSIVHVLLNREGNIMGPTEEISEHRKGVSDNNNNVMRFLYSEFDKEWP
jgi:hypothetical protein